MQENLSKRSVAIIFVFTVVVPLIVAITYNQYLGLVLFIIGLFISVQAYRVYNRSKMNDMISDPSNPSEGYFGNSGRTILVSLVDEHGRELPPKLAEQKLAEARAKAWPKDSVIGVKRPLK
jgi:hypothetical protein